jgi:hypothetical protein
LDKPEEGTMSFRTKMVMVMDAMLVGGACVLTLVLLLFLVLEAGAYVLG